MNACAPGELDASSFGNPARYFAEDRLRRWRSAHEVSTSSGDTTVTDAAQAWQLAKAERRRRGHLHLAAAMKASVDSRPRAAGAMIRPRACLFARAG
jgi:hypothetical protein